MSYVINSILSNKMVEIARYRCDKMRAHDDTNLYKWKLKMKSKHDAVLFLILCVIKHSSDLPIQYVKIATFTVIVQVYSMVYTNATLANVSIYCPFSQV